MTALENHRRVMLAFRQKFFESWTSANFDAVLCPALGFAAALEHYPTLSTTGMLAFSNLVNLLGVPGGTLSSSIRVNDSDMQKLEAAVNCVPFESSDPEEKALYANYGHLSPLHRSMFSVRFGSIIGSVD